MTRSTREVFDDHLILARQGEVETDIRRNFSPDCILLSSDGVFKGHEGLREAAELLARKLPEARYEYLTRSVEGEMAFLEWHGDGRNAIVRDGADSFLVRDGLIIGMTAHYSVVAR